MSSIGLIFLLGSIAWGVYKAFIEEKEEEEAAINYEKQRKQELKELVESREERASLEENEEKFWELIDKARGRSKNSFKNHLGVFKDYLNKLQPEELIKIDNLITRLLKEGVSYDLSAAAAIIFKSGDIGSTFVLMTLFMTRGEVFFNQAILDPKLIIGKTVEDIEPKLIGDMIDELYYLKAKKLIPLYPDTEELTLKGEPWKERDLPTRYSELWNQFA